MSATPPPPPPSSSSSAYGRPSGAPYRSSAVGVAGTGNAATNRPRPSPQQRPPTSQRSGGNSNSIGSGSGGAGINPLFTSAGGYSGPAPKVAGTGSTTTVYTSTNNSGSLTYNTGTARSYATVHTDPVAAGAGAGRGGAASTAAQSHQQQQQQPDTTPSAHPSTASADLLLSLTAAVHESLAGYLYPDAIELAQRLFNLEASYAHLHLLAHCYFLSGAIGTAYRLLHHHYPFFEVHVTRPRTAGGPLGNKFTIVDGGVLPLDGRRTWSSATTAPSSNNSNYLFEGIAQGEIVDLSYETVDLKAQWECQYLLGVCCYGTQHYEDGVKVLSQLMYVKHQLDSAGAALRKQQLNLSNSSADIERQLRSYAFATEARLSQVLYWLGQCQKHRQRPPFAVDFFRRAFAAQPTRLDAFLEYVRLAWPSEAAVQELLTVKEPLAEEEEEETSENNTLRGSMQGQATVAGNEEANAFFQQQQQQQRPPQRRGRDNEHMQWGAEEEGQQCATALSRTASPFSGASRGATKRLNGSLTSSNSTSEPSLKGVTKGSNGNPAVNVALTLDPLPLTASQRCCIQHHLQPFLRAIFLSNTYRCPEAVDAIQNLLQQEQQAGSDETPGVSRSMGFMRTALQQQPQGQAYTRSAAALPNGGSPLTSPRTRVRQVSSATLAVSPLLLRHLALAQFHNGDVQESAATFERLLRAAPWDLTNTAFIYYSTALWHLKNESALGCLAQRLTDAEPFHPTTLCVVANAYSLIKDPRDSLVMLKRAVQVAPTLAYAHALYGYELLGQDNKAEAERAFKTALAVDPTLYIAYAGLGERFIREEQVDKARGYYKEAVKINPTPAIMNRFALTYHRQNNSPTHLKCALRLYSESLQRHPNNVTARRQRTDVLLRLDRPQEALEELKALLVQCPGEAAIYITLAECMVCLRRPQEALQHYQTAMHLDPRRESYVQGCIDRLVAANML